MGRQCGGAHDISDIKAHFSPWLGDVGGGMGGVLVRSGVSGGGEGVVGIVVFVD